LTNFDKKLGSIREHKKNMNLSPVNPGESCLPSSAWSLVVVTQLFASVAITVQAAIAITLYMGKGSRMIHQILSAIAAISLIISVSSVMNIPARYFSVCLGPSTEQGANVRVALSFTFDFGG
jgi:hypothetical protein